MFGFSPATFGTIPQFALGRTAWDNWLMAEALRRGAALVDATAVVTCVHQPHDYSHTGVLSPGVAGLRSVATTPDARRNFSLMGGAFAVRTVRDATHTLVRAPSGVALQPTPLAARAQAWAWRTNSGLRYHVKRLMPVPGSNQP